MTKTWAVIICALVIACASQVSAAQASNYALVNGRLFNGIDNKIIENATVYVVDGKIDRIADADDEIPSGFTVIDLEQNT